MTEIERLILAVETKGVAGVNNELAKVEKQASATERAFGGLKASALAFVAVAASIGGAAVLIGVKLTQATKSYQSFMAALKTSTGSVENAKIAFQALQDFATTTPFSMTEVTTAFLKLTNLGLVPSTRALTAFGNIATSTIGKSLDDFVEAVADAAHGEFTRLKEFAIDASKKGEEITFMFRGVTEKVANNSKAIQDYLIKIGEVQFAGAMKDQMETLGGAISNLGDAWEQLWQNISNLGPGDVITRGFRAAGNALNEFNAQILSGEFSANLEAQWIKYGELIDDFKLGLEGLGKVFEVSLPGQIFKLTGAFSDADGEFKHTISFWPQYAKAAAGAIYLYLKKCWDDAIVAADLWNSHLKLAFSTAVKGAKIAGTAIAEAMTGNVVGAAMTATKELDKLGTETITQQKEIVSATKARWEENDILMEKSLEGIAAEVTATEKAYARKQELGDKARAKFEADEAARKAAGGDVLGGFFKGSTEAPTVDSKASKAAADKALKELERQFEEQLKLLEGSLTLEGQVIDSAYEARKEAILNNTATTEAEKKNLILQALSDSLVTEEQGIRNSYEARKTFILSATQLTEDAKTELMKRLTAARDEQIGKMEDKNRSATLKATAEFFDNLASMGSTFGKEAFEVAKAASIASATVKGIEAAINSFTAGTKIGGPVVGALFAAASVAATSAQIAQLSAQQFSAPSTGSSTKTYAQGGMIPAGRYGIVGESGAEIVRGPAVVTSAAATAGYGRSSGVRTVTIQNHGQPLQAESQMNGDQLQVVLRPILDEQRRKVKDEIAGEMDRGGSPITRNMERNYGLRREGRT